MIKMSWPCLGDRAAAANKATPNPHALEQNMRFGLSLACLPLAVLGGCATSGSGTPAAAPQISLQTLQRVTQTLSSDEYQGRGARLVARKAPIRCSI